jgi:hypothetical protein
METLRKGSLLIQYVWTLSPLECPKIVLINKFVLSLPWFWMSGIIFIAFANGFLSCLSPGMALNL